MAEEKEVQMDEEGIQETPDPVETEKEQMVPIAELRKVRGEAAKYRKSLRELEKQTKEDEDKRKLEGLEETDRLKAIAAKAEADMEAAIKLASVTAKRAAVIGQASEMGFVSPGHAAKLVDLDAIDVGSDGTVSPSQVKGALEALASGNEYLVKPAGSDGGSAFTRGPNPSPGTGVPGAHIIDRGPVSRSQLAERQRMAVEERDVNDYWKTIAVRTNMEKNMNPKP